MAGSVPGPSPSCAMSEDGSCCLSKTLVQVKLGIDFGWRNKMLVPFEHEVVDVVLYHERKYHQRVHVLLRVRVLLNVRQVRRLGSLNYSAVCRFQARLQVSDPILGVHMYVVDQHPVFCYVARPKQ